MSQDGFSLDLRIIPESQQIGIGLIFGRPLPNKAERIGKGPREAMTGEEHPHWLTLLGLGPLQPRQS
jgi:hypothetical protein